VKKRYAGKAVPVQDEGMWHFPEDDVLGPAVKLRNKKVRPKLERRRKPKRRG
jgi:hypothetical protein